MLAQAAGLALLAAVSPTALLIASVYLGSARPHFTVLCYLAGAIVMSTITAVVIIVALRTSGLQLGRNRTPRYGLRLGLGVAALAIAAVMAARQRNPSGPAKPARGIMARLAAEPKPVSALLAGLLVFSPSVTFIAAVQVIATARAGVPASVAGTLVVVTINAALVWLPLLAYLAWPKRTAAILTAFNAWLRSHGRLVLITALTLAGVFLAVSGLRGLLPRL